MGASSALRRSLFVAGALIALAGPALCILPLLRHAHSLLPITAGISLSTAQYLVSAIAQTSAAIGAVSVAVLFLTAQTRPFGQMNHSLPRLYRAKEIWALTVILVVTVCFSTVLLARLDSLIAAGLTEYLDAAVFLLLALTVMLIPAFLLQYENMDPVSVARRLVRQVTPTGIAKYGLSDVSFSEGRPEVLTYRLRTHALDYNRHDPLRPVHEVVRVAVEADDRLLLGQLIRVMLTVVARVYGVPFSLKQDALEHERFIPVGYRVGRDRNPRNRLKVCLHILHYVVRLARNLKSEWNGLDVGRHAGIFNVGDLAIALSTRADTSQAIELCILGIMHMSLTYSDVEPYGRIEPDNVLVALTQTLHSKGRPSEAELSAQVIGAIRARTGQMSDARVGNLLRDLPESLQTVVNHAFARSRANGNYLPGTASADPWR